MPPKKFTGTVAASANPFKDKNVGRRTGKDIKAGKVIRKNEKGFENFDDYWSESEADMTRDGTFVKPDAAAESTAEMSKDSTKKVSQMPPPEMPSEHHESISISQQSILVQSQITNIGPVKNVLNPFRSKQIGRRTGKDMKAGKSIRITEGGFENFDDYWSESDADSIASFHMATSSVKQASTVKRSSGPVSLASDTSTLRADSNPSANHQERGSSEDKASGNQDTAGDSASDGESQGQEDKQDDSQEEEQSQEDKQSQEDRQSKEDSQEDKQDDSQEEEQSQEDKQSQEDRQSKEDSQEGKQSQDDSQEEEQRQEDRNNQKQREPGDKNVKVQQNQKKDSRRGMSRENTQHHSHKRGQNRDAQHSTEEAKSQDEEDSEGDGDDHTHTENQVKHLIHQKKDSKDPRSTADSAKESERKDNVDSRDNDGETEEEDQGGSGSVDKEEEASRKDHHQDDKRSHRSRGGVHDQQSREQANSTDKQQQKSISKKEVQNVDGSKGRQQEQEPAGKSTNRAHVASSSRQREETVAESQSDSGEESDDVEVNTEPDSTAESSQESQQALTVRKAAAESQKESVHTQSSGSEQERDGQSSKQQQTTEESHSQATSSSDTNNATLQAMTDNHSAIMSSQLSQMSSFASPMAMSQKSSVYLSLAGDITGSITRLNNTSTLSPAPKLFGTRKRLSYAESPSKAQERLKAKAKKPRSHLPMPVPKTSSTKPAASPIPEDHQEDDHSAKTQRPCPLSHIKGSTTEAERTGSAGSAKASKGNKPVPLSQQDGENSQSSLINQRAQTQLSSSLSHAKDHTADTHLSVQSKTTKTVKGKQQAPISDGEQSQSSMTEVGTFLSLASQSRHKPNTTTAHSSLSDSDEDEFAILDESHVYRGKSGKTKAKDGRKATAAQRKSTASKAVVETSENTTTKNITKKISAGKPSSSNKDEAETSPAVVNTQKGQKRAGKVPTKKSSSSNEDEAETSPAVISTQKGQKRAGKVPTKKSSSSNEDEAETSPAVISTQKGQKRAGKVPTKKSSSSNEDEAETSPAVISTQKGQKRAGKVPTKKSSSSNEDEAETSPAVISTQKGQKRAGKVPTKKSSSSNEDEAETSPAVVNTQKGQKRAGKVPTKKSSSSNEDEAETSPAVVNTQKGQKKAEKVPTKKFSWSTYLLTYVLAQNSKGRKKSGKMSTNKSDEHWAETLPAMRKGKTKAEKFLKKKSLSSNEDKVEASPADTVTKQETPRGRRKAVKVSSKQLIAEKTELLSHEDTEAQQEKPESTKTAGNAGRKKSPQEQDIGLHAADTKTEQKLTKSKAMPRKVAHRKLTDHPGEEDHSENEIVNSKAKKVTRISSGNLPQSLDAELELQTEPKSAESKAPKSSRRSALKHKSLSHTQEEEFAEAGKNPESAKGVIEELSPSPAKKSKSAVGKGARESVHPEEASVQKDNKEKEGKPSRKSGKRKLLKSYRTSDMFVEAPNTQVVEVQVHHAGEVYNFSPDPKPKRKSTRVSTVKKKKPADAESKSQAVNGRLPLGTNVGHSPADDDIVEFNAIDREVADSGVPKKVKKTSKKTSSKSRTAKTTAPKKKTAKNLSEKLSEDANNSDVHEEAAPGKSEQKRGVSDDPKSGRKGRKASIVASEIIPRMEDQEASPGKSELKRRVAGDHKSGRKGMKASIVASEIIPQMEDQGASDADDEPDDVQEEEDGEMCTPLAQSFVPLDLGDSALKSGISFRRFSHIPSSLKIRRSKQLMYTSSDKVQDDIISTPRLRRQSSLSEGAASPQLQASSMQTKSRQGGKKERRVTISNTIAHRSLTPDGMEGADGSTTLLPSMSATPVHYHQMLSPASPARGHWEENKIVHPDDDNTDGLRRSHRTRVKPLEWYKNERIVYDRRKSGPVIVAVQPSRERLYLEQENLRRRKRRQRNMVKKQRMVKGGTKKRLSTHLPVPSNLNVTVSTSIPVLHPETREEVFMGCFVPESSATIIGPQGDDPSPDDPFTLKLMAQQKLFTTGILTLAPASEKPLQRAVSTAVLFSITYGKILVTINRATTIMENGDHFFIPRGAVYSLKNLRTDEASLTFVNLMLENAEETSVRQSSNRAKPKSSVQTLSVLDNL